MKHLEGKEVISYSKPRGIILTICYMVVASYLQNYGCAISVGSKDMKIPALLVFGDSIVDTGNNNYLITPLKANFPPYGRDFEGGVATGRFSNGKIPSDLIAEALGVKKLMPPYLDPTLQISDLLTGVSFASATTGYDPETAKFGNVLNFEDQLKLFRKYMDRLNSTVGENRTRTLISESMYLVCSGSNDIMNTYFALPFRKLQYDISAYTDLMVNWASTFIQELYSIGARKIAVCSTPPLGCLPSQRTIRGGLFRKCVEKENQAAIMYNKKLYSKLSSLNQKFSGTRIVYLDIYNPLLNLISNASSGFEVDKGCCGTGTIEASFLCTPLSLGTCKDASKYVFWDSFHPTEAAYRILVDDVFQKHIDAFL